ncbi:MAG: adenylate kinase [Thermoplasmata archaeon]|uniref:Adenylate kinase n=1 Tax=Candidatus Aciduliprofundum boonei TaxID=379547 RepID=A0A7J3T8T6_9ARCH|nr:adenylate kinase [Thermoplasmata archaeon]HHE75520.1 adenylate kinase [Candidatus Aciduliprofundum boonei]
MRIIVAGVPGVGKTTIMEEVAKRANYRIVNYGTVMFNIAQSEGLVRHRDEMRKLPIEIQRRIQKEAAKKIGDMENIIVDTHLTIKTPAGYLPGLPVWVLDNIRPNLIVIIEAKPEEIKGRRERDETRKRDYESEREIKEHLEANRYAAFACSIYSGANVLILENNEGMVEKAVEKFMEALK